MRVEKAGFQIIEEPTRTKQIERIARICYKSEDKIGEGSDKKMVASLLKRQHTAMLEHANIIFEVVPRVYDLFCELTAIWTGERDLNTYRKYCQKSYLRMTSTQVKQKFEKATTRYIVSGNFRAWHEFVRWLYGDFSKHETIPHDMEVVLSYVNESTDGVLFGWTYPDHVKLGECAKRRLINEVKDMTALTACERMIHEQFSVLFTCDRGVSHELVRMRQASFAQESTRYVNYAKEKFGSEISVVEPFFWQKDEKAKALWEKACKTAEDCYMELVGMGIPAQQARCVLPHSTKVEIVVTANLKEWRHIFELRACDSTGPAHPQMKQVMVPLLLEMQSKYWFAFGDLTPAII